MLCLLLSLGIRGEGQWERSGDDQDGRGNRKNNRCSKAAGKEITLSHVYSLAFK